MSYKVNEIFYSLQGEGIRAGTPNIFVRFSNCNLRCSKDNQAGFDCDTEFLSGQDLSLEELFKATEEIATQFGCHNVIFTGGEPALQLDGAIIQALHLYGYYLCIETNGTMVLPDGLDWICVSPKSSEHSLRVVGWVNELKYVRSKGQEIPKPSLPAHHYLISPAFDADGVSKENLDWAIKLVKENPKWRLSMQLHKLWKIR